MSKAKRELSTRNGKIQYPAYIPVSTLGERYPLDNLIRPYLPRLAQGVMVSFYYAQKAQGKIALPIFLDSGGFTSLFKDARVSRSNDLGVIKLKTSEGIETIHPYEVLELQEKMADVAFTLDFPIPLDATQREAKKRQKLTIANAHWALTNRRRKDLPLFASIQAWDAESARECARAYKDAQFDGIAIGGLVPRVKDLSLVLSIVRVVREEIGELPLHVFGIGGPKTVEILFKEGVDSVDSSSYVKLAADGRLWSNPDVKIDDPSPTDRLHLALCNLATATSRALPLSAANLAFTTHVLDYHATSKSPKV